MRVFCCLYPVCRFIIHLVPFRTSINSVPDKLNTQSRAITLSRGNMGAIKYEVRSTKYEVAEPGKDGGVEEWEAAGSDGVVEGARAVCGQVRQICVR